MLSKFFTLAPKLKFVPTLLKTQSVANKLSQIYAHPFNEQLFDGTLSTSVFGQYLHDDYIYLHHYARVLNKLSTRAPALTNHLSHLAADIIAGEQSMQEQYKEYFTHTAASRPGRAITNYINFLINHTEKSEIPVALCSVLPCFWIYYQLGSRKLHPNQLTHNPFRSWIETYSSPEFVAATYALTDAVDQLAEQSDAMVQAKMKEAFEQAVSQELAFFDEVHPAHSLSMGM